ncbi:MAG: hypothetical protein HQK52_23730 [Oligoflexia bacterium]|nr:hypothetical protein [Oligoflexia bacterium]
MDFLNNIVTGEFKTYFGEKRSINNPLYDVVQTSDGIRLKWRCKMNAFLKYQAMKKIKKEKYPNLLF